MVVDGLWCPNTNHVLPLLGITRGEVDSRMRPVDEIGTLQQHHTTITTPTIGRTHIGDHHIECLTILATQNMRIAHALGKGDGIALDDRHTIIQRRVVVTIVTQGVANLLVLGVVTIKIGEEVSHHLVGVFGLFHHLFLFPSQGGANAHQ